MAVVRGKWPQKGEVGGPALLHSAFTYCPAMLTFCISCFKKKKKKKNSQAMKYGKFAWPNSSIHFKFSRHENSWFEFCPILAAPTPRLCIRIYYKAFLVQHSGSCPFVQWHVPCLEISPNLEVPAWKFLQDQPPGFQTVSGFRQSQEGICRGHKWWDAPVEYTSQDRARRKGPFPLDCPLGQTTSAKWRN